MQLDEFDYYLPEELIAQTPLENRDEARLMVVDRKTRNIEDKHFYDVLDYLDEGDTLVLNDTKVLPARLIGEKEETGAVIEVLLLKNISDNTWECLCKPARRVKVGCVVSFGNGKLKMKCVSEKEAGIRDFVMIYDGIFYEILDDLGTMPLPPYIHEKLNDQSMYQTVYAREVGSAAAPTAGLHFTNELLEKAKLKNINVCYVTLHVGLGTFRPVTTDNILEHKMHSEFYQMSSETADLLNETKRLNKKIISVGTTSTRVLETIANKYDGIFREDSGWTDIFIYPGYDFKAVDCLITNFHLPKSTLIMLVSALADRKLILEAYESAVSNKYRFFSFGDAMLIK
ncbi:MAG: tRNA preQ1(34) S-adenosylmethionine ribosyltransferase-isomerase QueA [Bacilli bacterium]|nr:tRNA preQ1(34) S-adenosylmethionine ribosyltransferase-isomerase QueA [Bacilli bacterium]